MGSGTRRRPMGRDYAAAKDAEGGIVEHGAKSMAQSGQKGASKRITTEGHGAARKDTIYKYVASV